MKNISEKLELIQHHISNSTIKIMILGLGSVGIYLLDYLLSSDDPAIQIIVAGRNYQKMEKDVNIVKIGALIRNKNRSEVTIEDGVDLNDIHTIETCIKKYMPDFIVNSSRVYAGLKYGSISWNTVRAYGIWSPLAIKYIKNIMDAYALAGSDAIVINTSYSDAIIPWLKSAGHLYPDFGSGNLNHLMPRIKFAVSAMYGITDFWNINVVFATAHFHDVVISKEGHTEGIHQLLKVYYQNNELMIDQDSVFAACKIPMPVDSKRNIMNASSNYNILLSIIDAIRMKRKIRIFSPGVFGEMGGYPVMIDGTSDILKAYIDESAFSFEQMNKANRRSLTLDGIEDVKDGVLIYTDSLIQKVQNVFDVTLPKEVPYEQIDTTADFIIKNIIEPYLNKS